jgi:hypothetical protein
MLARTKLRIILPFLVLLVSGAIYFSLVNSKTTGESNPRNY